MNKLYSSSWVQNVQPLTEAHYVRAIVDVLNEAGPGKKGKAADPRYARLMGIGSVKQLAGTMTPRYFATKVIRQLEADHPEKKIEDITDDELLKAMNLVANLSRKLSQKPTSELTFSTQKAEDQPKPEEKIKKGSNAFETVKMNLGDDAVLKFEEDTPLGYGVYTAEKDGMKFRVALKEFDGKPIKVSELAKDNVASLVVTEPKKKEKIEGPTMGDLEAPKVEREKPILDMPAEVDDSMDLKKKDSEALAYGDKEEFFSDDEDEESDTLEADEDLGDFPDLGEPDMDAESDEECEDMEKPAMVKKVTVQYIKPSPQQVNRDVKAALMKRMRNNYMVDRKHGLGY